MEKAFGRKFFSTISRNLIFPLLHFQARLLNVIPQETLQAR